MNTILKKEQQDIIYHLYVNEGRSLKYCANAAHTNDKQVRKFLVQKGIKIRSYAINRAASSRPINKDEQYFSRENYNMAWLLGFLASDGTVSKNRNTIKIGLAAKDKEILEKIKKELQLSQNNINLYVTNKGFDVAELSWTSQQHKNDLAKYNIIPQKTLRLKPPYILDKKYFADYLRGYFDGDGSIKKTSSGKGLVFSICSATKEILEYFISNLNSLYGIPPVKIIEDRHKGNHILYYFCYSTNASKQIYNILYSTPSSLYLQRKKEKYEELMMLNDISSHETTHLQVEDEKIC